MEAERVMATSQSYRQRAEMWILVTTGCSDTIHLFQRQRKSCRWPEDRDTIQGEAWVRAWSGALYCRGLMSVLDKWLMKSKETKLQRNKQEDVLAHLMTKAHKWKTAYYLHLNVWAGLSQYELSLCGIPATVLLYNVVHMWPSARPSDLNKRNVSSRLTTSTYSLIVCPFKSWGVTQGTYFGKSLEDAIMSGKNEIKSRNPYCL